MKHIAAAIVAAISLTLGTAYAADTKCPPCAIKKCPEGTACRPPCEPAAPCSTRCPDVCAKCPDCVVTCPEGTSGASGKTKTVIRYEATPRGHWSIPVTVGFLPAQHTDISWDETLVRGKWDPEIAVAQDRRIFGGVGVGYQWSNRWQLAGQLLYVDQQDADSEWTLKSHAHTHPMVLASDTRTSTSGSQLGFAVTLSIPIGK